MGHQRDVLQAYYATPERENAGDEKEENPLTRDFIIHEKQLQALNSLEELPNSLKPA